jgi:hypothetical protein
MFFRTLSISSSCIIDDFSFFSLCKAWGLSGVWVPSSMSLRPLDTRLVCFRPSSVRSGKLA